MSVAVAVTVTIPNYSAAQFVATGTEVGLAIGPEVKRLVLDLMEAVKAQPTGAVTVSATVT